MISDLNQINCIERCNENKTVCSFWIVSKCEVLSLVSSRCLVVHLPGGAALSQRCMVEPYLRSYMSRTYLSSPFRGVRAGKMDGNLSGVSTIGYNSAL